MKSAGIIGAGVGGLTAALILSSKGFKVKVFEKNSRPGGKLSEFRKNGYRFDTGPTLLTMPFVFDMIFEECGMKRDDFFHYSKIDRGVRNFFPDGMILNTYSTADRTLREIAEKIPSEKDNFKRYLKYSKGIYDKTAWLFLFQPFHELKRLLFKQKKIPNPIVFLMIDAFRTMHKANSSFFKDERLISMMDRFATYNGSDPYRAPATLNIIPYVEYVLGAYYPDGGLYRIIEGLEKAAAAMGTEFHYDSDVQGILTKNNKAKGLKVNREKLEFDYIISNADVSYTFEKLLGINRKTNDEPSLSGMVYLWGINRKLEELAHHNVFFPENYKQEFIDIFDEKRVPSDPAVYVSVSARTEAEDVPAGKDNLFILVNMPNTDSGYPDNVEDIIRDKIFQRIIKHGFDITSAIEFEEVISPFDLEGRLNAYKGSIYGGSSNNMSAAFRRQANRCREISNLYFAGGSAHPGGGIPLTALSGKHCADLIIEDKNK
ncbi:MAG: phytoene desaturase family protein [Candidatus Kapaibacterium sp.]